MPLWLRPKLVNLLIESLLEPASIVHQGDCRVSTVLPWLSLSALEAVACITGNFVSQDDAMMVLLLLKPWTWLFSDYHLVALQLIIKFVKQTITLSDIFASKPDLHPIIKKAVCILSVYFLLNSQKCYKKIRDQSHPPKNIYVFWQVKLKLCSWNSWNGLKVGIVYKNQGVHDLSYATLWQAFHCINTKYNTVYIRGDSLLGESLVCLW